MKKNPFIKRKSIWSNTLGRLRDAKRAAAEKLNAHRTTDNRYALMIARIEFRRALRLSKVVATNQPTKWQSSIANYIKKTR